MEICLFSSFLLFRTRYVRYLMPFGCMYMRIVCGEWKRRVKDFRWGGCVRT